MALVKPWFPNATHGPRQEMHEKGQTFSVEYSAPSQCSVSCHRLLQQQTFQPGGATSSVLGKKSLLEPRTSIAIYSELAFKDIQTLEEVLCNQRQQKLKHVQMQIKNSNQCQQIVLPSERKLKTFRNFKDSFFSIPWSAPEAWMKAHDVPRVHRSRPLVDPTTQYVFHFL